jgi:hypothetical protein
MHSTQRRLLAAEVSESSFSATWQAVGKVKMRTKQPQRGERVLLIHDGLLTPRQLLGGAALRTLR